MILRRVRLRAVLAIFRFSKYFRNIITEALKVLEIEVFENQIKLFDSAQYHTAQSPTLRSVRQFWIFGHFNFPTLRSVILRGVGLRAV